MIVSPLRLRLGRTGDELRDVQHHFPAINALLNSRRDDFTELVECQDCKAAYEVKYEPGWDGQVDLSVMRSG
jgi:hypothetical protein